MLGVVVPAHNEEEHIASCVESIQAAARHSSIGVEEVLIVVVLDACTDGTAVVAQRLGATVLATNARNVGVARSIGANAALAAGARWLAFTDADSVVAPDWLSAQLMQRTDAVCGTIEVDDWGDYAEAVRMHHQRTYRDVDGHRHIHGANLGVSAAAYRRVGGFPPLRSSEDVALVNALHIHGASIAWSASPRVVTSARRRYRAPRGFGETLARVEAGLTRGSATS